MDSRKTAECQKYLCNFTVLYLCWCGLWKTPSLSVAPVSTNICTNHWILNGGILFCRRYTLFSLFSFLYFQKRHTCVSWPELYSIKEYQFRKLKVLSDVVKCYTHIHTHMHIHTQAFMPMHTIQHTYSHAHICKHPHHWRAVESILCPAPGDDYRGAA